MKKLLCMILSLMMVLSLCACGTGTSDKGPGGPSGNKNNLSDTEAVAAALVGTWLPDHYAQEKETAEVLKFNEDGTVEMLGATYTWKVRSASAKDSASIAFYDGETCFNTAKYYLKEGVRNDLVFEYVQGSREQYKLEHLGYHKESDYQVIEITMDNYEDYFETVECVSVTEDSFGDATKITIRRGLAFNEEHGKVNHTISQGAFEFACHTQSRYEVTADKATAEYTFGEKVYDGNPHTNIEDCQKLGVLDDHYGILFTYGIISEFPTDTVYIDDEIEVTRVIGTLYVYTPAE